MTYVNVDVNYDMWWWNDYGFTLYILYEIGIDENDISIKVSITRGMNRGFFERYANANPNVTEMLN